MITSKQLQNEYIRLYPNLRNYIWPISAVEDIANLEISTFTRFPDIDMVKRYFNKVNYNCNKLVDEDEELKISLDRFSNLLETDECMYAKLDSRTEGGVVK